VGARGLIWGRLAIAAEGPKCLSFSQRRHDNLTLNRGTLAKGVSAKSVLRRTGIVATPVMAQAHMHHTDGEQTIGMEAAVHLIAMAAKALLILGGAILIGEVVVTSERRLHGQQKRTKQMVAEDTITGR